MTMINSIFKCVISSCRQLSLLPKTCSLHSHHHFPHSTSTTFQLTRGFANRCNTHKDGGTFRALDFGNAVKSVARSQMEAALEVLPRDMARLPTGLASVELLDRIFVIINGVRIPVNKMAAVKTYGSYALSVTPYYPHTLRELEKAIAASQLGIYPKIEEKQLTAYMYPLSNRDKQAACRLVIKSSEHVKQSIRRVRLKAPDTIQNSVPKKKEKEKAGFSISGFTADDAKKLEKEVDDMTTKYIKFKDRGDY